MAKANSMAVTIFLNLALIFLLAFMVDGRLFGGAAVLKKQPTPHCKSVYGVHQGDTCFEIAQQLNMTIEYFNVINPNLNCNKLFIGQWVCVDGVLS
ncbi:hypothetical protein IFM89_008754 [Coptis chinensis]|nr:hypothetical protein IFM89_008754 [Coptis chinensis]